MMSKALGEEFISATSGAAAQAFITLVLFPLDAIKTRMQVASDRASASALVVARRIVDKHGITALWGAGLGPKLVQAIIQKFSFFFIFAFCLKRAKRIVASTSDKATSMAKVTLSTPVSLTVGYVAALVNTLVTLPLEVASNCILADVSGSAARRGLYGTAAAIYASGGAGALYRGIDASVVLCLNPALSFGLFERFKTIIMQRKLVSATLSHQTGLTTAEAFWLGAVAKAFATLVTFPAIRAKLLIQTKGSEKDQASTKPKSANKRAEPVSMHAVLAQLLRSEGILGLYKGVGPQLSKGVLSSALLLAAKERISEAVGAAFRSSRTVRVAVLKAK